MEKSEEGIHNPESSEPPAVLQILRKKDLAPRLDCGRDDQRVAPRNAILRKPALGVQKQRLRIESLRRMHGEQRAEDGDQVLSGVRRTHVLGKPFQRDVEELLHHLIADDSLLRRQRLADESRGFPGLRWCASIERT